MKQWVFKFLFVVLALGSSLAKDANVLPDAFNGWQQEKQTVKRGNDPAVVDAADGAVLKEYGFSGFESATYTRNGRQMQVKVAHFNDASGAYGAFTFYVQPQMQTEKLGDQGAYNNNRI